MKNAVKELLVSSFTAFLFLCDISSNGAMPVSGELGKSR